MIYSFSITTPANTAKANKQRTDLKITKGTINQVDIVFPSGPAALLHVVINRGLHQAWPSNPDEDFASDNDTISLSESYDILAAPYILKAFTWNLDDTWEHGIIIRIGLDEIEMEPEEEEE